MQKLKQRYKDVGRPKDTVQDIDSWYCFFNWWSMPNSESMYGIFTYMYHKIQPFIAIHVGKYTIHGWFGMVNNIALPVVMLEYTPCLFFALSRSRWSEIPQPVVEDLIHPRCCRIHSINSTPLKKVILESRYGFCLGPSFTLSQFRNGWMSRLCWDFDPDPPNFYGKFWCVFRSSFQKMVGCPRIISKPIRSMYGISYLHLP